MLCLFYTMRNQKSGIADNLQLSLPYRNIGLAGRMAFLQLRLSLFRGIYFRLQRIGTFFEE